MATSAPTKLKIAIVTSGRKQREIAAEIGTSEGRLSKIVLGQLHADDPTRRAIAHALRVPADEQDAWIDEMFEPSDLRRAA